MVDPSKQPPAESALLVPHSIPGSTLLSANPAMNQSNSTSSSSSMLPSTPSQLPMKESPIPLSTQSQPEPQPEPQLQSQPQSQLKAQPQPQPQSSQPSQLETQIQTPQAPQPQGETANQGTPSTKRDRSSTMGSLTAVFESMGKALTKSPPLVPRGKSSPPLTGSHGKAADANAANTGGASATRISEKIPPLVLNAEARALLSGKGPPAGAANPTPDPGNTLRLHDMDSVVGAGSGGGFGRTSRLHIEGNAGVEAAAEGMVLGGLEGLGLVDARATRVTSASALRAAMADSANSAAEPAPYEGYWRHKLVAFYTVMNKEKLPEVDSLLQRHKGREERLFRMLRHKYPGNETSLEMEKMLLRQMRKSA